MVDVKEYGKLIRELADWPLEETPYPEHYPEDLKYDPFPGKDFVVGLCDEQIEILVNGAQEAKGETRDLLLKYADLFEMIKTQRVVKLKTVNLV